MLIEDILVLRALRHVSYSSEMGPDSVRAEAESPLVSIGFTSHWTIIAFIAHIVGQASFPGVALKNPN